MEKVSCSKDWISAGQVGGGGNVKVILQVTWRNMVDASSDGMAKCDENDVHVEKYDEHVEVEVEEIDGDLKSPWNALSVEWRNVDDFESVTMTEAGVVVPPWEVGATCGGAGNGVIVVDGGAVVRPG